MTAQLRSFGLTIVALFLAGCSGNSSATGVDISGSSGGGVSNGASSDSDSSSSGAGGASTSGSTAGSGSADDASGTPGTGSIGGRDEDATVADSSTLGGVARDASVHDASIHDGAVGDAAGGQVGDGGDALAAARAQCVQIINQDRATLNPPSPPLQEDTAEEACVDGQAQADYQANTAHSAFGKCRESAQDECPNWPGPPSSIMTKCLAQMWAEGPPPAGQDNHWLNMSNAKYKRVACGFYQTPSGKWWATQDFY